MKAREDRLTAVVFVRCAPADRELVRAAAHFRGVSLAHFVREAAIAEARFIVGRESLKEGEGDDGKSAN